LTSVSFGVERELAVLGMKKEAVRELDVLSALLPAGKGLNFEVSKLFSEYGDHYRSLLLVLRSYERFLAGPRDDLPREVWLMAYPLGYWDDILRCARKYGQDPYFIAAVIRQESRFSPEAASPAGALGLMQVMPATGERAAAMTGRTGFEPGMLFDAETGIDIGTWYVSRLMKRFKNDPLLTAAAYNAGPEAVVSWLGGDGKRYEQDVFAERIPFSETRGYVKKVLRNYAEYKRIYGGTAEAAALP
jgi:soluble lytic murein transglycosylase